MNEHIAHSGAWGIALIVIVAASWFLYRYLAPKTWKEWASAGVVQAFIIALYAEMYGFPLTIYLLVRFFGLDQTNLNANLWSTLLGLGETGMMISMILGYALLFAGIGIFMEDGENFTGPDRKPAHHGPPLRSRAASPVHRTLYRALRRGHRSLAHHFFCCAFPRHRSCLFPAGAKRGTQNGGTVR